MEVILTIGIGIGLIFMVIGICVTWSFLRFAYKRGKEKRKLMESKDNKED